MKNESSNEIKLSSSLIFLFAAACGLIVANLYYAQPLVGLIGETIHIQNSAAGLIVTMTQLGYAAGLLCLVPLSDLMENRKLILCILAINVVGLLLAGTTNNFALFFAASVLIGLGAVAAQILVPLAAHLSAPEQRGKVVGNVMSGLLLGIMLARPVSSVLAGWLSWRVVFFISAALMVILMMILRFLLPQRKPAARENYSAILRSMGILLIREPILRRRALYQAALFGSFSLFWTVVPMWLASHYGFNQKQIAIFAFAGVAGAIASPIVGRLADKGWTKRLTAVALVTAVLAYGITHITVGGKTGSLILLCVGAILLDMSVSGNLVLGQQSIYTLGDEIRGRLNGIFMAIFFLGGAAGSALGGWVYAVGAWNMASLTGAILPLIAFLYFLTERKSVNS